MTWFYSTLRMTDDVTIITRWIRDEIEILRGLGRKKSRLRDCFAENSRLRDAKNHSKTRLRGAYNSAEILRQPNFW